MSEQTDPLEEYLHLVRMARDYTQLQINYAGEWCLEKKDTSPLSPLPDPTPKPKMETSQPQPDTTQPEKDPPVQTQVSLEEKTQKLVELQQQAGTCMKCRLGHTRTQVVFGSGAVSPQLVVIGEAPGYHEDQQGVPFVGNAGQLLTKMLAAINLDRSKDVYICNVIKCRPPKNRDPQADEIVACRDWLCEQLKIFEPKLLCSMGKFAAQYLTGIHQSMWKYRGNTYEYEGIPVVCTYHPSYLLRSPHEKKKAWEDLKRVKKILDQS